MTRLTGPIPEATYVTAASLADTWLVPLTEVYHRAYRARWRRTRTRPVGYLLLDVMANDGACLTKDRQGRRLGDESGTVCPATGLDLAATLPPEP